MFTQTDNIQDQFEKIYLDLLEKTREKCKGCY